MNPYNYKQIIDGKLYNTETAVIVAHDAFWDGSNFHRNGTNCFLYKTKKGNYFSFNMSMWQGSRDYIEPLSKQEAKALYEDLPEKELEYQEAFDEEPIEA